MLQGSTGIGEVARRLRSDMSLPEVLLWQRLRRNELGVRFRCQHPCGPYVADFYCHKARLVIEIDGATHDCGTQPQRDMNKDTWCAGRGLAVVRIPASEVLADVDGIADAIIMDATSRIANLTNVTAISVSGDL